MFKAEDAHFDMINWKKDIKDNSGYHQMIGKNREEENKWEMNQCYGVYGLYRPNCSSSCFVVLVCAPTSM